MAEPVAGTGLTEPAQRRPVDGHRPGLVETKLTRPPAAGELVERGRLVERLSPDAALAVVVAPPGSGKTTLCAQLAHERATQGGAVAWVNLDRHDRDPARFWAHVLAALERAGVDVPTDLDPASSVGDPIVNCLARLTRPLTLVLDDFHEIPDGEVTEAFAELVARLPSAHQIVIASRVDPPMPTPLLRVRGQLAELRVLDLNFTLGEAERFLQDGFGIELQEAPLHQLHERTEGWAAALKVAALGLRRSTDPEAFALGFAGDQRHLVDFLDAEVIAHQDDDTLDFLIQSSILDELDPDLCDHVLEIDDSARILGDLDAANQLVIPLDDQRRRYRYHQLFVDVLRARLDGDPTINAAGLHLRAADWHADHADPSRAITHFVDGGRPDLAREVINDNWLPYIDEGRSTTVWGWLDEVPSETRRVDPLLCRLAAWAKLNVGAYDEIDQLLAVVDAAETSTPNELAEGDVIRSHRARHRGNASAALDLARSADERVDPANGRLAAASACALGVAALWAGEDVLADGSLRPAIELAEDAGESTSLVAGLGHLALLLALQTDTDDARDAAERSLALCSTPRLEAFHVPVAARLARARLALDGRRLAEADRELVAATSLADAGCEPLAGALARLWATERSILLDGPKTAQRALADAESAAAELTDPGRVAAELNRMRNDVRFGPRTPTTSQAPIPDLTDRERTVLRMLAGPGTRQEIARELHVSLATVKTHTHAIARKLHVSRRRDIVARARELGLI